jgi:hypothetical protein
MIKKYDLTVSYSKVDVSRKASSLLVLEGQCSAWHVRVLMGGVHIGNQVQIMVLLHVGESGTRENLN